MSDPTSDRVDAAVSYARQDEAVVEPLLAGLRAEGLAIWFDKDIPGGALWEETIARKYRASGALLFFVSKASLASQRCSEEVSTARTLGKPIIPVLLERLKLPEDLPDRFVLTLQARNAVEAYDRPDEEKRRGILRALAAFGIGGAAVGVADAGTIGAERTSSSAMSAQSSSSAPVVRVDPLAKSNAGVVKASSKLSSKTLAFGGAAAATLLVVGAIIVFQGDKAEVSAPARTAAASPSTSSVAPTDGTAAPSGDPAAPAAPRPTPEDIETGGARVTLESDTYRVGYPIPVRVENMPGHERDYVAVATAGSPGYGEVRYEYLRGRAQADIVLRPVMKPGDYEVRLFFGNDLDRGKSDQIRFSIPLTILPADPITLTPDQASLIEGRTIRIAYEGLPGNDKDWISTAEVDSPDGSYVGYTYSGGRRSGTAILPPVMKPGSYEIRVYFDDLTSDRTVQARIPIEVAAAPPVTLSLDAAVYRPGAPIAASFALMPGNQKDWLALSRTGEEGYLSYEYTDGETSGVETFRAPDEPGAYEIRAYFDDTTGDRNIRAVATFTVAVTPP